ncbi:MAG: DUF3857 domain-containing protein [Gemmatimonadota bacterium]|nr:DUF3857 domain-containing protein [Gemmatimonadota bacterium]
MRILHREHEDFDDLEARTVLASGEVIKVDKKDFHKNTIKTGGRGGDLYVTVFAFPALEPGCIIEYKYEKKTKGIEFLEKWYFQNELYTFHSEITAEVSSFFIYNYYLFPPGVISKPVGETTSYYRDGVERKKGLYTWELDNIPEVVREPHSPPVNSCRIQIFFALSALNIPRRGRNPEMIPIFDSWKSVVKMYYRMYRSIEDSKEIRAVAEECTGSSTDRAGKIRDIFNYIKAELHYSRSSATEISPASPKSTLKNKKGDTADLSALMIQMLRDVDIEAHPAVILTRHDPPFLHNFPSPTQLTKMIVYVPDPEAPLWIDPAGSFVDYKNLPWTDQGQTALIIDSEEGTFSKTPSSRSRENVISHEATMTISPDGSMEVDGSVILSGLPEEEWVRKIDKMTDEERRKYVKQKVCQFITDAEITALDCPQDISKALRDSEDSLRIHYCFTSASAVQAISDRLIVNPALSHRSSASSYESVRRFYPVVFKYPYSINVKTKIIVPEGFELEEAPKAANSKRSYGRYMRNIEDKGNELLYEKKYSLPKIMFSAQKYSVIRKYYQKLESMDKENLVLRKKGLFSEQDSTQPGSSVNDNE